MSRCVGMTMGAGTWLSLFVVARPAAATGLSFITIGDWGGFALEETSKPYHKNVVDVATQMAATAEQVGAKFIVNTGDNFYWCGIENTSDFQVEADWVGPYKAASLQVPWYGTLGNHEYGYNVEAQIELGKKYKNWVMDARYYTKRLQLDASNFASVIFLDTSPCVSEYRGTNPSRYDPCGTAYPTCSLSGGSDSFEGTCKFHANIMTQSCETQGAWLKKTLAAVPADDWKIVVGHHQADDIDVVDFTGMMQASGVDLYLNGHAHVLTHYTVDGKGAYITSGAGSLVLTHDQLGGSPAKDRTFYKVNDLRPEFLADPVMASSGHSFEKVFNVKQSGFTLHTFSADYKSLTNTFLDTQGNTLHEFKVTKGVSPAPSPGPAPAPSPAGDCCYYHSKSCNAGQPCCSTSGTPYTSEDSCTIYGKKHHCKWEKDTCEVGPSELIVNV